MSSAYKTKFHGSSFLVDPRSTRYEDVANMLRENRACPRRCYGETAAVEFRFNNRQRHRRMSTASWTTRPNCPQQNTTTSSSRKNERYLSEIYCVGGAHCFLRGALSQQRLNEINPSYTTEIILLIWHFESSSLSSYFRLPLFQSYEASPII